MGPEEEQGVVSSELIVHGTRNLRVVSLFSFLGFPIPPLFLFNGILGIIYIFFTFCEIPGRRVYHPVTDRGSHTVHGIRYRRKSDLPLHH